MTETQKILALLEKASPREQELTYLFLEKLIQNRPAPPKQNTAKTVHRKELK